MKQFVQLFLDKTYSKRLCITCPHTRGNCTMTFPPFRIAYTTFYLKDTFFCLLFTWCRGNLSRIFPLRFEENWKIKLKIKQTFAPFMHCTLLQRRKNLENVTEIKQFCAPFKTNFTPKDIHHMATIFFLELEKLYKLNSKWFFPPMIPLSNTNYVLLPSFHTSFLSVSPLFIGALEKRAPHLFFFRRPWGWRPRRSPSSPNGRAGSAPKKQSYRRLRIF